MHTTTTILAAATHTTGAPNATGTILGVLLILFIGAIIMNTGVKILKYIIRSTPLLLLAAFFGYLIYF